MGLIDMLSTGIETLGRKANQALDEGKLRMDLLRVRRRKDNAARDLGYVVYRQTRGTAPGDGEVEFWVRKIGEAEEEIARLEEALRKLQEPTPAPTEPTA
jgi:hypothetical protein